MLSKSKFHLFLIMKINNYKNNLLVNFYIRNNIYKNTVFKNSGILFLKISDKNRNGIHFVSILEIELKSISILETESNSFSKF